MEIIFSLHNGLPVSALGEGSVAVSSPGFPIPVRQRPSPVEKWVPRLLKGPTCQRSRGISHSQPPYCSPGHNRQHGARPFVINSVVNFCWGNKSVTHLQLWIRSFFSTLFSLLSCLLWHIAHGSVGHIKSNLGDKKTGSPGQHPKQWWTRCVDYCPCVPPLSSSCVKTSTCD